MERVEKAKELMKRAEELGVRLEVRSGWIVAVKQTELGHPKRQDAILEELAKCLRDVRPLVERRAMAAYASKLLGARILYPEFTLMQINAMEGVLASASGDGAVAISVIKEGFRDPRVLLTAKAQDLLIVLDEEETDCAGAPQNEDPKSRRPRRGIFGFLGRGPGKE
jgi:hypothetical protein